MHVRPPFRLAALLGLVLAATPAGPIAAQDASPAASGAPVVTDANGDLVVVTDASRIVTLGGVVTETVYALGAGDQVVAVDASSFHPPEALADKAVLGYYRMMAAEPLLAVEPTLVLGTDEVGPPEVVEQIRAAGVTTLLLPPGTGLEGAHARIFQIGHALGRDAEAAELDAALQADLDDALSLVASATSRPKVLFFLLPPGAPMLLSGTGTEADTMIGLAGADNAVTSFPGYIPLTPEVAAAAAPDVILTTTSSLEAAGGVDALLEDPTFAATPAAANRAVVAMDDLYLLGFGPRTGRAVQDLARALHPELAASPGASASARP